MSKYTKDVRHLDKVDVYDIIQIYEVTNPALQHALKKILMAGKRGHKDFNQDIQDIIDSVNRAKELEVKPQPVKSRLAFINYQGRSFYVDDVIEYGGGFRGVYNSNYHYFDKNHVISWGADDYNS